MTAPPPIARSIPCARSGALDNKPRTPAGPADRVRARNAPPRTKVLTPLFEAKVEPDIYFLGFDLTVEQARGGTGEHPDDDPGWFFVIKERPGEPRFGLDLETQTERHVWNDLSWGDVLPQGRQVRRDRGIARDVSARRTRCGRR